MPKVAVYNVSGSQVGEVELADAVFGIEPHAHVMHEAVLMQQASLRQGTHKVKGRSEVRGGGRKPWKQKKVPDVHAKEVSVHLNGRAAVSYSARLHAAMLINFLRKFAVWQSSRLYLPRWLITKSSCWIN